MRVDIRKSFLKDADKLSAASQSKLHEIIQAMERADNPLKLENCRKLSGQKTAYRVRMGSYRIGFYYSRKTIELVRILGRDEIYKYFP